MIRHDMPSLLVTVSSPDLEKSIESGKAASGRLASDLNASHLQKSLSDGIPFEQAHLEKGTGEVSRLSHHNTSQGGKEESQGAQSRARAISEAMAKKSMVFVIDGSMDRVDPNLVNTHGESFHTDADQDVVRYLTETGQIDVANCPVHNNPSHPAPTTFPMAPPTISRSNSAVESALEDISKSFSVPPKKPSMRQKKAPKDPVQKKQEDQQKKEAGIKKSNATKAGEGSRGGKVIGHTKSGKPKYALLGKFNAKYADMHGEHQTHDPDAPRHVEFADNGDAYPHGSSAGTHIPSRYFAKTRD